MRPDVVVLDASALIDLLVEAPDSGWIAGQLRDKQIAAPATLHYEVMTAFAGLLRRGQSLPESIDQMLTRAFRLPVELHSVADLVGAWRRRDQHSIGDALYVELAWQLDTAVITTDRRLARATGLAVAPPG